MFISNRQGIIFLSLIVSIGFFSFFLTAGCVTHIPQIDDPPTLQLDAGPTAWVGTHGAVTDKNNDIDKWQVKQHTPKTCEIQDPATGKWYSSTVDDDGKVEFSQDLLKQMEKDRQEYWKNNPDKFQEWLNQHPEQKKQHKAWQEKQRALSKENDEVELDGGDGH